MDRSPLPDRRMQDLQTLVEQEIRSLHASDMDVAAAILLDRSGVMLPANNLHPQFIPQFI